ncbi:DUF4190 domain-containing protein [Larsenimonas suaedae]|uniref:DUF4190 domain-containing protein n=1 Tax=Larsenimonas suaedae TaxID=1851019 RepID=A0ABU1GWN7_9GAMM|nr:DUF4190 domain-containing protein [Larsenimonas suaedae]MCM2973031.1 DUF4190 domain-containing protein [Larsenimonas suaedae]MDR5896468.1 DUF4190 domain-containing protein [Larsenimonas suaedae]
MTLPDKHASTNVMALVAFGLSLLSFFVAPACLGSIVCGHVARAQIRRSHENGDSWAVAGLVIGYLMLLASVAGLLVFGGVILTFFGIAALA